MPKRIYVGNLPVKMDKEELEKHFSGFGPVRVVDLNTQARTATLDVGGDVEKFVSHFDGKSIGNTVISVRKG